METIYISFLITTLIYMLLYVNLPFMHGDDFKETETREKDDDFIE